MRKSLARTCLFPALGLVLLAAGARAAPIIPRVRELPARPGYKPGAPPPLRSGAKCAMPRAQSTGITKQDACGRWFCVKPGFKDFMELHPDFRARNKCKWKLTANRCLCVKANGKPTRIKLNGKSR